MITQTAEYALRAAADLATHHGRPRTAQQMARATHVPPDYLSKVMKELVRAGIVRSQRGVNGGFSLLRDPDDLPVYDVINAVNPIQRIRECPLGLRAHARGNLCPLHRLLDDAMEKIETAFKGVTLGQLARQAKAHGRNGDPLSRPLSLTVDRAVRAAS